MSDLDGVTYSRLSIIDLYSVLFSSRYSPSFLKLHPVIMGVLIGAQCSILNFINVSLIYLI
jgi:xanthine/uracil permease